MTRIFLPESARESLLASGRATWRKQVEPQPEDYSPRGIRWLGATYRSGVLRLPNPPGSPYQKCREYWVPESWQRCVGCNPGRGGVIYRMGLPWVPAHPWRSAATMPREYARLHVRVTSVRVVKDGRWWWEIELERITE